MLTALELRVPPPVLALVTALVMWAGAYDAAPLPRPGWLRAATLGVLLTGGLVAAAAILALRSARTTVSPTQPVATRALVRTGIYGVTRNPIYLGALLVLTALAMFFWQPQSFVALPVFAGWIHRFQILPEERVLREKFGAEFEDYVRDTRRWI
jgi:protein-S-isoprenylcysteine O-methyltransferase Ste14